MIVPVIFLVTVITVFAGNIRPVEPVDQHTNRNLRDRRDLRQRLADEGDLRPVAGDHKDDGIHQRRHDQRVRQEKRRCAVHKDIIIFIS